MLNSFKDAMTAKAAQAFVNGKIGRYGQLSTLKIDSKNKSVEFTGLLHGEREPVTVEIGRYVVEEVGDKRFISVKSVSCSRPWLQALLEDFVRDRRTEVPSWAASAL